MLEVTSPPKRTLCRLTKFLPTLLTRVFFAWPVTLRSKVRYALPGTSTIFSANFGMSTYNVSLGPCL